MKTSKTIVVLAVNVGFPNGETIDLPPTQSDCLRGFRKMKREDLEDGEHEEVVVQLDSMKRSSKVSRAALGSCAGESNPVETLTATRSGQTPGHIFARSLVLEVTVWSRGLETKTCRRKVVGAGFQIVQRGTPGLDIFHSSGRVTHACFAQVASAWNLGQFSCLPCHRSFFVGGDGTSMSPHEVQTGRAALRLQRASCRLRTACRAQSIWPQSYDHV